MSCQNTFASILKSFEGVKAGEPILIGHIFFKLHQNVPTKKIANWASEENVGNGFPIITFADIVNTAKTYKKYKRSFKKKNAAEVLNECKKPLHTTYKHRLTSSSSSSTTTTSSATSFITKCDASTNTCTNTCDAATNTCTNTCDAATQTPISMYRKRKRKLSSNSARKLFYICKLHNVASKNIPCLVKSIFDFFHIEGNIFSTSTVFKMPAELGFIADYMTVDKILNSAESTLIFDATTKDGEHINSVLLSTPESTCVVSIERLPGGYAKDYADHINGCISKLAQVYSKVSGQPDITIRENIISKISSCLTDRAAVNHRTLYMLELQWNKELIELNCNIHPLEAISRDVCLQLKQFEDASVRELVISGKECIGHKIIMKMSSLRYSNTLGLITEFKDFLGSRFSTKLVPRYRGNRINIIFHLAFVYFRFREDFLAFLRTYRNTKSLCKDLEAAFGNEVAYLELQVLGVIGKLLSGPWMKVFYTSLKDQHTVTGGIMIVQGVVDRLKILVQDPIKVLESTFDFFGNPIDLDEDLVKLMRRPPSQNCDLFTSMMKKSLEAIICVIQRQYATSFERLDRLREAALSSARLHTMEAESVFGEFSGRKQSSSTLDTFTIGNLIKANRNKVLDVLHGEKFNEKFLDRLIELAKKQSTLDHQLNIQHKKSVTKIVRERISDKNRKKLELDLKNLERNQPSLPNT